MLLERVPVPKALPISLTTTTLLPSISPPYGDGTSQGLVPGFPNAKVPKEMTSTVPLTVVVVLEAFMLTKRNTAAPTTATATTTAPPSSTRRRTKVPEGTRCDRANEVGGRADSDADEGDTELGCVSGRRAETSCPPAS